MKSAILLSMLCATPALAQLGGLYAQPDAIARELHIANQLEQSQQLRDINAAERARVLGEQERSERRYQPHNDWTMPEDGGGDDE